MSDGAGRPLEASAGTRPLEDPFPLVFELSREGRRAWSLPEVEVDAPSLDELIPESHRRTRPPALPEVSERDLVRHYTRLSQRNWAIDVGAYPLGSCTMKYNPKVSEDIAALPGFSTLHPMSDDDLCAGALELLGTLERALCEATGMAKLTFQPAAGAQGELTGLLIMRAFHTANGEPRRKVIIPDSAHGTNPASVTLAGYEALEVPSDDRGLVDLDALESVLDDSVAGLMLTNPNTLGLFERDIKEIAAAMHRIGGLLYYDGANFNSIVGVVRPGDMGFDIVHMNLHKTFATPHGGGGPGSGPLAVSERLARFLPAPVLGWDEGAERWYWDEERPDSIGRIHSFHGNFGINVRAYAYLRSLGPEGLKKVAERAVLNANYLKTLVEAAFPTAYPGTCMHEFVSTAKPLRKHGVRGMDVAKRLIDLGYHPPTVYFPLVVEEALMVEPTETESKETIDGLAAAMNQVAAEAESNPDLLHAAPVTTPVRRPDEARAAARTQGSLDALTADDARPIDAVIFDMDGVLIDSEPLWQRAEIEIFPEVGIELTVELCRRTMGLRIDEVVDHWHKIHPWDSPSKETVARRIVGRVGELIRSEGGLLPGVTEALDLLGSKARLGLASSSYYELIDAVLDGFDLRSHFDVVYSAEDEPYGKPHPGIYLTTADKLGSDPTRCVAIEDSPNGVLAAKAARMKCIAVPVPDVANDPRMRLADVTIESLTEINDALWEQILRR